MKIAGIDPSINGTGFTVMELDESFEILDVHFYALCTTNKWCIETEKVHVLCTTLAYKKMHIYDRENISINYITEMTQGVEYCAFEDFSYDPGQNSNSFYQIGEFVGALRKSFYERGIPIDRYAPKSIKMYAVPNTNNAGKLLMMTAFKQKYPEIFPPEIENDLKLNDSPQTDINDSFWICEILRNKLKVMNGLEVPPDTLKALTSKSKPTAHSLLEIQPEKSI